ncbi:mandelate racemase/muconate lactonizing enzyme family protein [Nitratireductor kimnyeongensis]|uniref:Mandelate racemase/muconate lactonizing enzyme family protein n=1 Tax=Nitratireductor kimnyeongensis TaxID=430679 RepID=A0ABW0T8V9_9HYPH|nr:mandelate racemase/muconate lactonizing enzyme family protein [Nitratireductor kimnyeongensis]QZZ36163.1 mandelate racemase/muconate lactonizing enzyme family protein [Nitratireductor kimnyeongensis]
MTHIANASVSLIPFKLKTPVGGSGVGGVDVIIVELTDMDGATGLGFSYVLGGGGAVTALAARQQVERFASGAIPPPQALWRNVAATFNRTGLGPNLVALAALDMAAWDLESRSRGVPLGVAMGGAARPVPVYGSGGFNAAQTPDQACETALRQLDLGLRAFKPRARGARIDALLLAAVRKALPDDIHLMTDANEKCDLAGAMWLMSAARDNGLLFVEEPLPSTALEGYRALAARSDCAIATGEHLQGRGAALPYLSERLATVFQPDLAMMGGLTPILEISQIAAAFDIGIAPHFLPGLFAHVASAAANVTWLEDFPLLEPMFEGWPQWDADGRMSAGGEPGHGLTLKEEYRRSAQSV